MSVQSSVQYLHNARAAAIDYGPTSQQAHDALASARTELEQDFNSGTPPIADWILLIRWLLEQTAIAIDEFLEKLDSILAAIEAWEVPP